MDRVLQFSSTLYQTEDIVETLSAGFVYMSYYRTRGNPLHIVRDAMTEVLLLLATALAQFYNRRFPEKIPGNR